MPATSRLSLTSLPPELIDQILGYLSEYDVVNISSVCHKLYHHSRNDSLWQGFIQKNVSVQVTTPGPCDSFKQLFTRHHPRWFLTRHKIWFSDYMYSGKLLIAIYDARRGSIEAYALAAERGRYIHGTLDWDGLAEYNTFYPKIQLDVNIPIVYLTPTQDRNNGAFVGEFSMDYDRGVTSIASTFTHSRYLTDMGDYNFAAWPPSTVPSPGNKRTRNESQSGFLAQGHMPNKLSESSDATFRIRQWIEFHHFLPINLQFSGMYRRGEVIQTFGTIREECYTPTKEKPWQGIWCGDYSGHGCEFLLIMQTDLSEPLPEKAKRALAMWPHTDVYPYGTFNFVDNQEQDDEDLAQTSGERIESTASDVTAARRQARRGTTGSSTDDVAPYKGRLIAVKLTGDPNIPRGEITFIAEDLGSRGLVGFAQEPIFNEENHDPFVESVSTKSKGKANVHSGVTDYNSAARSSNTPNTRHTDPDITPDLTPESDSDGSDYPFHARGAPIVRSVGHIANRGFLDDEYIPSQLIMVSENTLAQYWRCFGSVSFYKRVNLDQFLAPWS